MHDLINDACAGLCLSDGSSDLSLELSPVGSVTIVSWLVLVPKFEVRHLVDTLILCCVSIYIDVDLNGNDTGVVLLKELPSFCEDFTGFFVTL